MQPHQVLQDSDSSQELQHLLCSLQRLPSCTMPYQELKPPFLLETHELPSVLLTDSNASPHCVFPLQALQRYLPLHHGHEFRFSYNSPFFFHTYSYPKLHFLLLCLKLLTLCDFLIILNLTKLCNSFVSRFEGFFSLEIR